LSLALLNNNTFAVILASSGCASCQGVFLADVAETAGPVPVSQTTARDPTVRKHEGVSCEED
jgi:hypothetical protein